MKINFLAIVKKWSWRFNLVYTLLFICTMNSWGQNLEKTFVKEIAVSEKITVATNVPTSLDFDLNDSYSSGSNTKFGYIVYGKTMVERLYIHKEFKIHTWEKNVVKQEVKVEVKSNNTSVVNDLLEQLKISLSEDQQQNVMIDANMNIDKFTMDNRRFSSDNCKIILENGTDFPIEYLAIKTTLYIPKTANLKVKSILNHTLRLDDLEGDLDLDIQYGEVYGKKIKNLNSNLRFCYNVIFEEAENVIASATNSHLKIDKVKSLRIGDKKLRKLPLKSFDIIQWVDNNSSMNIYNFREAKKIVISDTANDDFRIGEVDHLEIKNSIFSNYKILKVNEIFHLIAKNGDISISEVSKNFKLIDLNNTHSKITINVPEIGNYGVNIFDTKSIEYKLPPEAKMLEKESKEDAHFKIGENKNTGTINIHCDRCELDIWN